jgi:hypothetical protein
MRLVRRRVACRDRAGRRIIEASAPTHLSQRSTRSWGMDGSRLPCAASRSSACSRSLATPTPSGVATDAVTTAITAATGATTSPMLPPRPAAKRLRSSKLRLAAIRRRLLRPRLVAIARRFSKSATPRKADAAAAAATSAITVITAGSAADAAGAVITAATGAGIRFRPVRCTASRRADARTARLLGNPATATSDSEGRPPRCEPVFFIARRCASDELVTSSASSAID